MVKLFFTPTQKYCPSHVIHRLDNPTPSQVMTSRNDYTLLSHTGFPVAANNLEPRERRLYHRHLDTLLRLHRQRDKDDLEAGQDMRPYNTIPPSTSEFSFNGRLEVVFVQGDPEEFFALQDGARIYAEMGGMGYIPELTEGYPDWTSDCSDNDHNPYAHGQFRGPPSMRAQRALRELETLEECLGVYERQLAVATWRHRRFPCRCAPRDGCHRALHVPSCQHPFPPPLRLCSDRAPQARPLPLPF